MRYLVLLLFGLNMLWAEIGVIGAISGSAELERANTRMAVTSGLAVQKSDRIITAANAKVQIMLHDDTIITIGEASIFELNEYLKQAQGSALEMTLHRGYFRAISGKIGKLAPERFKLKTRSATIGIRGTDFGAFVHEEVERVACFSGAIDVSTAMSSYALDAKMMIELLDGKWQVYELDVTRFRSVLAAASATPDGDAIRTPFEGMIERVNDVASQFRLQREWLEVTPGYELQEATPPPFTP